MCRECNASLTHASTHKEKSTQTPFAQFQAPSPFALKRKNTAGKKKVKSTQVNDCDMIQGLDRPLTGFASVGPFVVP